MNSQDHSNKSPELSPTEVVAKAIRRKFSASYKQRVLQQADECRLPGELGALLRREGLYSSHLAEWRRARERGEREGLSEKKRGPKPAAVNPLVKVVAQQEREIANLKARLANAELICDAQKKVSLLLGITLAEVPTDETNGKRK